MGCIWVQSVGTEKKENSLEGTIGAKGMPTSPLTSNTSAGGKMATPKRPQREETVLQGESVSKFVLNDRTILSLEIAQERMVVTNSVFLAAEMSALS